MARQSDKLTAMQSRFLIAVALTSALMFSGSSAEVIAATPPPIDVIRDRITALRIPTSTAACNATLSQAAKALSTQLKDGTWPDLDYEDTDREHWSCAPHLQRMVSLATASKLPDSADPQSSAGVMARQKADQTAAVLALHAWLARDPQNDNWWHNQIHVPIVMGTMLLLLRDAVPVADRENAIDFMNRARPDQWTGGNLVWGLGIQIARGCAENSYTEVADGFNQLWQQTQCAARGQEGLQADFTFHQHGDQLYNGGYGDVFAHDESALVATADGTPFTIPAAQRSLLVNYLLNGQQWVIRNQQWDYSVDGRDITGAHDGNIGSEMATWVANLKEPRASELAAFAARLRADPHAPPLSGNRAFWCSDYMVQQRPDYFASVRGYSTRTVNTDSLINGENRQSHHISDGTTYFLLSGREYCDIFPVWDWHRIPGTTVEQDTVLDPDQVNRRGDTDFVGGVSDGTLGCMTMDLQYDALTAHKSWFFFDHELVCLGSDIRCDADHPVNTTINQCWLDGPVRSAAGELPHGHHLLTGNWIWHDWIGYIPLGMQTVHVRNDVQHGNWTDIGTGKDGPLTGDVFSMWIDHGSRPSAATYAYAVMPACEADAVAAEAAHPTIVVLENDAAVQAVYCPSEKIIEAIFREPATVHFGDHTLNIDQPCSVLVHQLASGFQIAVASPSQQAVAVHVQVGGSGTIDRVVKLPAGAFAGSSVVLPPQQ